MGDVLFSSTPWLQQDNLQEMGGGGARENKISSPCRPVMERGDCQCFSAKLGLVCVSGVQMKKICSVGRKRKKMRGVEGD